MLVLRRKIDQEALIRVPGRKEPIVVTVLEAGKMWVKLGFAAEDDVRILRKELEREGGDAYVPRDQHN